MVPIPQEVAQAQPSAHAVPIFHHGRQGSSRALTWPAQRSFPTSALYRSVDLVETHQASHRPNVRRRSKFNPERGRETAEDRLRGPNLQWRAHVLRWFSADESYGILMLGDAVRTIGTDLLPNRLSLCGGHPASRILSDSWRKQSILGVNRFGVTGFESTPVRISVSPRPASRLPRISHRDQGSPMRCCRCANLGCM